MFLIFLSLLSGSVLSEDFRADPAFIRLQASTALEKKILEQVLKDCPKKKEHDLLKLRIAASRAKIDKMRKNLHKKAEISHPPGPEYLVEFQKKLDAVPGYFALKAQSEKLQKEADDLYEDELRQCEKKVAKEVFQEVDLYEDEDLTKSVAKLRLFGGDPEVARVEYRLQANTAWKKFPGDFTPEGEWGYTYHTLIEKRGDRVLLPKRPFLTPVWLRDTKPFERTGHREEKTIQMLSSSSDLCSMRSHGEYGKFWVKGIEPGKLAIQTVRGEKKWIPWQHVFDSDGHLTVWPANSD